MKKLAVILMIALLAGCATSGPNDDSDKDLARAKVRTELAVIYYQRTQYKVALDQLAQALNADSEYAPAYNVRGLVYMTLKEDGKAESDFRRSLTLDPDNPDTHINYGWFLCQRGREKDAISHFLTAAKNPLYSTPEKGYLNAGICSKMAGQTQNAEKYLQRALLMHPEMPEALAQLAEMSFIAGDYAGASSYFMRFERATTVPMTAENLLLAVRIERGLGDTHAASAYAKQLQDNFPDSREAQLLKQLR
jgi:type IV pilus assembly protein PilF